MNNESKPNGLSEKDKLDFIFSNIQDARNNILERVKQREISLIFYLGAVSTIVGVAFNNETSNENILLLIPFLSLGITLLISFHNSMMNSLSEYIVNELEPEIRKLGVKTSIWDTSKAMSYVTKRASRFRVSGFLFLILFPPIFSLIMNFSYINVWQILSLWIIGIFCVIISSVIYISTVNKRWKFHSKIFIDEEIEEK